METKRLTLIYALSAASALAAGTAAAADAKVLMGGSCLPVVPASSTYNPWKSMGLHAVNNHSAALTYQCLLTRDNETVGTGLANATVSVYTPAGATTACTLRSVDKYGTSKDWHVVSFKAGSKAAKSDLAFGSNIGTSVDGGGYGMTCSLEPGAKIFTYRYTENSP